MYLQTTAIGALLIGGVITRIEAAHTGVYKPEDIARVLSFLSGLIVFLLGILRLGWLIEFVPSIPISAFVTSASITIIGTQLPTVLGITGINTHQSTYKIYIDTLKGLDRCKLDAAIGITSITLLWLIRNSCARMEARQPYRKRMWSLISSLRLAFTMVLYTLISWLVNRGQPAKMVKFRVVGHIEKGFSHVGVPPINQKLFGLVAPELPALIIILIVEHIAIAKSFGRTYNYTVIPSQEMIAQGTINILSPFLGGFACTASFGASAVLSKAAVRTPLAGLFSAIILVLALYALTAVFYFIPNAALGGLIIHCTLNLITPPKALHNYWHLSPFELFVWVCGVVIAFFSDLQTAIYVTVGLSFGMLFIRTAKCSGTFRGSVGVTRIVQRRRESPEAPEAVASCSTSTTTSVEHTAHAGQTEASRNVYLPYKTTDAHNPAIKVDPVHPGIFIYRFSEMFNYINKAQHIDYLTSYITSHTRRTQVDSGLHAKDQLWCDVRLSSKLDEEKSSLAILRAVILDMSTVNIIDLSSVQGLVDLRKTFDQYAAPAVVEWHFAGIQNRWTRRALSFAGFGCPATGGSGESGKWSPAYTVAVGLEHEAEESLENTQQATIQVLKDDEEKQSGLASVPLHEVHEKEKQRLISLHSVDKPFFHLDLHDAVDMAVRIAKKQDERCRPT